MRVFYLISILVLANGCARLAISGRGSAAAVAGPPVTPEQVMEMAEAYGQHEWRGTQANVFHGTDSAGVRIDTPDAAWIGPGGWDADGRTNVGIPYCWGGYSTLAEFDEGIAAGRPAGNHFKTMIRGRGKDPPDSALPVGVDCSGFVSRCWRLDVRRSTYDMAGVCRRLPDYEELLPGDALNKPYNHIILFTGWMDAQHERLRVFEAGDAQKNNRPENYQRVHQDVYDRAWLAERGFVALRYWNIVEVGQIEDAARVGSLAEVKALLKSDPSQVSSRAFDDWPPLDEAADNGYVDIAKVLVANNADVNVKAKGGRSPLFLAAMYGHADIVELLLENGADADVTDDNGVTPLHLAAWDGYRKVAKLLLAHGADVNARDKAGETPLTWATERGDKRMVKLLLARGAEVNARGGEMKRE